MQCILLKIKSFDNVSSSTKSLILGIDHKWDNKKHITINLILGYVVYSLINN